jgi:hypothetical protein
MGRLRFTDIQPRPTAVRDWTRLTLDALQRSVPPVEAAFQAPMAQWRLDGRPRTARQYPTSHNGPLPTPEELSRPHRHLLPPFEPRWHRTAPRASPGSD